MTRLALFVIAACLAAVVVWHFRGAPPSAPQPQSVALQPLPALAKAPDQAAIVRPYSPPAVHARNLQALVDRNAPSRVTADISARIPEAQPEDFPLCQYE